MARLGGILLQHERALGVRHHPIRNRLRSPPPTIHSYLPGEIKSPAVVESLRSRDEALVQLRQHLLRAQQRMTSAANKHRRDIQHEVGDMVYLKFRPYRQSTLFSATNRKLAPCFFGPFRVEACIGKAAYRLQLPAGSRIHPVFDRDLHEPPQTHADEPLGTDVEDDEVDEPSDDEEQPVTGGSSRPKRNAGMPKHLADYELY